MNNLMKNSLLALVISPLALGTTTFAAKWDMNNDPNLFNVSWHPVSYTKSFSQLPLKGELAPENTPWGDSYWPKQRGAMSYRYLEFSNAEQNQLLTESDRQRLFFSYNSPSEQELITMSQTAEGRERIRRLSPLEKYSIFIGDFRYKLVKEYQRKNSANDASWEGYCHAWSAAALHYPEPAVVTKTIRIKNTTVEIPFGSADVKALLTANYADKFDFALMSRNKVARRQIGTRCNSRFQYPDVKVRKGVEMMTDYGDTDGLMNNQIATKVSEYQANALRVYSRDKGMPWVRLNMPELLDPQLPQKAAISALDASCEDTNAGAFHIVMSNQIALKKEGFQIDKTRDYEIWNQPVHKFESEVLGEERPSATSAPGTVKVKIVHTLLSYADDTDFGWAFFFPTLAGLFGDAGNGFMEEFNKYNQVLVQEGNEETAPQYPEGIIGSANYTYKLDLDASGNIIGGDWLSLDRPDFLWITAKLGFDGKFDRLGEIYQPMHYHY